MGEYTRFNYWKNRDKAFTNLIAIIDGVTCDGNLDQKEVLFLDTWLLESEEISDNYCIKTLRRRVSDLLLHNTIDKTELKFLKADLIKIQEDLIDFPNLDLYSTESDRILLDGLCKGILANNILHDSEIKYLKWFISKNSELKNSYPGNQIYSLIEQILHDGIITADERQSLKQMLTTFTGCDLEAGVVDGLSTQLPIDRINSLNLAGSHVCLTGEFLCGKRSICEYELRQQGAIIVSGITFELDYLIIGTLSSKDWRYKSYGRKIEKAVSYRDEKGCTLQIITEEQWKNFS